MKEIEYGGAVLKTMQYTGRKTIDAVPMTKADAELVCGRRIPAPDGEGYLVIYPDGYKSWSPKDVFEDAYKVSETPLDRMKLEADELAERIVKANKYLLGDMRKKGSEAQKHMLDRQIKAMKEYLDILELRKKIYIVEEEARKKEAEEPAADATGTVAEEDQNPKGE